MHNEGRYYFIPSIHHKIGSVKLSNSNYISKSPAKRNSMRPVLDLSAKDDKLIANELGESPNEFSFNFPVLQDLTEGPKLNTNDN